LKNNNEVLLAMGDMQEKASGAFVFDRAYVRSSYQAVAEGVKRIIDNLNILSDEKYKNLIIPYNQIDASIRGLLVGRVEIPVTDYVLPLKALGKESAITAGGKFAFLGEIANALDIPVPSGFVITTYAYQTFILHNKIQHILTDRIKKLDIRKYEALQTASREMQELVRESEVPKEIETGIWDSYRAMREETRQTGLKVSVRSSAIHEDILASFAGQYESALNVPEGELLEQYKRVLASQFTPQALFYYMDKGFAIEEMAMAVGVLAMVRAKASGILYSRDPGNPDEDVVLINAVWGLGSYAVGGKVPTDNYLISGKDGQKITRETGKAQDVMLVPDRDGGTREVPLPGDMSGKPCLDDKIILQLATYARKTEDHFRKPQDMEWAMDNEDRLYLLQSRPLRLSSSRSLTERSRPTTVKGHRMLLDKGIIACRGVGAGPVYIIHNEEDLLNFPEGGVMVIRHTYPEFAAVLKKAAAVVSDIGSVLGHLATVAREYNVPAIFNTERATRVLTNGKDVTVDAVYASVYEGIVEELLKERNMGNRFEGSPILKQLREILEKITPLNLTDPRGPRFRAMECKTLHDITRFVHEVSLRAIFNLGKESHFAERSTKQLVSGVPMKWWVIDLEDGLVPGIKGKKVTPEEIVSVPMCALWKGMTALPWKGPPPVDAKGFMSVMLSSTTDPSIDPSVGRRFADKNYIIVSKHFCNVSTRLGFHFSTTEAYLGDQENQNYIEFVYTGGGADPGRKSRRAALITKILEKFDFRVEKKEDTIFARIEGHKQDFLEERMKMLGHLIVHTRQMDMVMYNDAMVDWYYKDLLKGIKTFINIPE
ncbi:MAG: PEP/pyruvate-binding domain-containing protein, partial [Pseudomonadota bacterium]